MRYFVFTDIHGNSEALGSVLQWASEQNIDHYLFLGDMVGYGASPNEVINRLKDLDPLTLIRGNHDKAVCQPDLVESFNPIAATAIHWTKDHLGSANIEFLKALPQGPTSLKEGITICHGAPFDEDFYIFGEFDAAEAFIHFSSFICFFGHTHYPFIYSEKDHLVEGTFVTGNSNEIQMEDGIRYLINPGSVGQPRDRNNKAACAVYDSESRTIHFQRLEYDISSAQNKILNEYLPPALADRLSLGI
jgi:predicted phosphodiesterase